MLLLPLGPSGLTVSRVVAGAARSPVPVARGVDLLNEAWDTGVRALDVTDGADARETSAARFLEDRQPEDAVVLAAVGVPIDPERGSDLSADRVGRGVAGRARRLGRVDAVWVRGLDAATPPEATVEALAAAIENGTIRAWGAGTSTELGTSEADVRTLEVWLLAADAAGLPRPAFVRCRWNLLDRRVERDLLPLAAGEGVAVLAADAFATGRLTDRHVTEEEAAERAAASGVPRPSSADPRLTDLIVLRDLARERSVSTSGLALAHLLGHPAGAALVVPAEPGPEWDAVAEALETSLADDERERIDDLLV